MESTAAAASATSESTLPSGLQVFSYRLGSGPISPTFT